MTKNYLVQTEIDTIQSYLDKKYKELLEEGSYTLYELSIIIRLYDEATHEKRKS